MLPQSTHALVIVLKNPLKKRKRKKGEKENNAMFTLVSVRAYKKLRGLPGLNFVFHKTPKKLNPSQNRFCLFVPSCLTAVNLTQRGHELLLCQAQKAFKVEGWLFEKYSWLRIHKIRSS